jgi:hypothetical protein
MFINLQTSACHKLACCFPCGVTLTPPQLQSVERCASSPPITLLSPSPCPIPPALYPRPGTCLLQEPALKQPPKKRSSAGCQVPGCPAAAVEPKRPTAKQGVGAPDGLLGEMVTACVQAPATQAPGRRVQRVSLCTPRPALLVTLNRSIQQTRHLALKCTAIHVPKLSSHGPVELWHSTRILPAAPICPASATRGQAGSTCCMGQHTFPAPSLLAMLPTLWTCGCSNQVCIVCGLHHEPPGCLLSGGCGHPDPHSSHDNQHECSL